MKRMICKVLGHKVAFGELKRSPHTVYTHWRDAFCPRCGAALGFWKEEYHDARKEPELFRAALVD